MKKKFAVLALVAMFVCVGVFAQEEEVPTDNETTESVPAESTPTTGGRPPMYFGVELGYGSMSNLSVPLGGEYGSVGGYLAGFEAVPVFGIAPFSKLPGLALEFNLMMDFLQHEEKYEVPGTTNSVDPETGFPTVTPTTKTVTSTLKATVIAPQVLAVYTFAEGPVRPFLGAGFGVNINSAEYSSEGISIDAELAPSFDFVTKAGAVASIPNTKFDLIFLARYNLNISNEVKVGPITTKDLTLNMSNLSFSAGARFNF